MSSDRDGMATSDRENDEPLRKCMGDLAYVYLLSYCRRTPSGSLMGDDSLRFGLCMCSRTFIPLSLLLSRHNGYSSERLVLDDLAWSFIGPLNVGR